MTRRSEIIVYRVIATASIILVCYLGYLGQPYLREQWWIHRLQSTDPEERQLAATRLGELRSVAAVPILVRYLVQGDNPIGGAPVPDNYLLCEPIAKALEKIGDNAVPALIAETQSNDEYIVAGAIIAIVNSGTRSPNALASLKAIVNHTTLKVHKLCIWAIEVLAARQ
jgi:HEAT repeat protein